jgi:hypothetical protein
VHPTLRRWVKVGDSMALERDAENLLPGNRSAFVRTQDEIPDYTSPQPWTP